LSFPLPHQHRRHLVPGHRRPEPDPRSTRQVQTQRSRPNRRRPKLVICSDRRLLSPFLPVHHVDSRRSFPSPTPVLRRGWSADHSLRVNRSRWADLPWRRKNRRRSRYIDASAH
jgi:hypothetical protein